MRVVTLLITVLLPLAAARAQNLVIHEWGTFTSLQNDKGEAIGWINTDDEPVPQFVHTLDGTAVFGSSVGGERTTTQPFTKGLGALHPDATMRLETPVIYFHRPAGTTPLKLDLSVEFHGGYLTQFYPDADAGKVSIFDCKTWVRIKDDTVHGLRWDGLQIGGEGSGPVTDAKVWTAPRNVKADAVRTVGGESERFLFYRGVGHLEPPVRVREIEHDKARVLLAMPGDKEARVSASWLVDVRSDGGVAFRKAPTPAVGPLICVSAPGSDEVAIRFDSADFAAGNLNELKATMQKALVAAGLFDDEATAMLNTWEASYFKSPGLRVFYIVPPAWVDKTLPLKVSVPADITRVMVGRIELITPEQKAILAAMSSGEVTLNGTTDRTLDGRKQLGRFAGAMMNDVQHRSPTTQMGRLLQDLLYEPASVSP